MATKNKKLLKNLIKEYNQLNLELNKMIKKINHSDESITFEEIFEIRFGNEDLDNFLTKNYLEVIIMIRDNNVVFLFDHYTHNHIVDPQDIYLKFINGDYDNYYREYIFYVIKYILINEIINLEYYEKISDIEIPLVNIDKIIKYSRNFVYYEDKIMENRKIYDIVK